MLIFDKEEPDEKTKLIRALSPTGDRYGNVLLSFMERYGLHGLVEATEGKLREFAAAGHYI